MSAEGRAEGAVERARNVVVDDHADAPAASALVALRAKVHVPRLISAMWPAGNPAKSAAMHPRMPGAVLPKVLTGAVTSPLPEYSMMMFSTGPAGAGETRSRTVGVSTTRVWAWSSCRVTR